MHRILIASTVAHCNSSARNNCNNIHKFQFTAKYYSYLPRMWKKGPWTMPPPNTKRCVVVLRTYLECHWINQCFDEWLYHGGFFWIAIEFLFRSARALVGGIWCRFCVLVCVSAFVCQRSMNVSLQLIEPNFYLLHHMGHEVLTEGCS